MKVIQNAGRRVLIIMLLCYLPLITRPAPPLTIAEVIRQAIKKVIVAVDLKIQRLQNQTIWLQNAQRTVENALSRLRLEEIRDWSQKHREQYQVYYAELWNVRGWIKSCQMARDMLKKQALLLNRQQSMSAMLRSGADREIIGKYIPEIERNLSQLLKESAAILSSMQDLLSPGVFSMGDPERLERMRALSARM